VRGNHEDCERAHEGYRLMLNNEEWGKDCKKMEAPQIIELGDITLVNLDSSSVNDTPDPSASQEKEWVESLNKVSKKLEEQKRKNVWIISHKPFYGMAPFTKTYLPLNLNLRKYLEKSELIKKVQYIFSGHVHTSMIVKGDNFPMQIVLGDGGTKLTEMTAPISEMMLKIFKYKSAEIVQDGFGYMLMTKKDKHWTMEFKNAEGKTVKTLDI
jgi:DNA repair exonuclease SbcCD nuclease subunit